MSGLVLVSYFVLWFVTVTLAVAVFALYRHFGEMYLTSREGRDRQGPEKGVEVEVSHARNVAGESVRFPVHGRPLLMLFTSTGCTPCQRLLPELADFVYRRSELETVLICQGDPADVRRWSAGLPARVEVIPDATADIATRYGIGITPFCVSVDAAGVVRGKGLVNDGKGLDIAADDAVGIVRMEWPLEATRG